MRVGVLSDGRVLALVDEAHAVNVSDLLGAGERPGLASVNDQLAALTNRLDDVRAYVARSAPQQLPIADHAFVAPSPRPRTLLAAPVNYQAHRGELGSKSPEQGKLDARSLGLIVLAPASITGPAGRVELPDVHGREFHFEGEIAVVIGRSGADIAEVDALAHVLGYTGLLDVTMRLSDEGREDRSMRKSYHTFTPIGPYLLTADEVRDPAELTLELFCNGVSRQEGMLRDLIVDVPELVARASRMLPLQPGDVIATGTPSGVGPITPGDELVLRVSGVGDLCLPVTRRGW